MADVFDFKGLAQAEAAFEVVLEKAPHAMVAILTEAGLFGERETKLGTRVLTGKARASIGHFTPNDMTKEAGPKDAEEAKKAAYFEEPTVRNLEVSWGSRLVYVPVLNYKLGDLMFEKGLQTTIHFIPVLCDQYLGDLFK